jgi:hypothetical protein
MSGSSVASVELENLLEKEQKRTPSEYGIFKLPVTWRKSALLEVYEYGIRRVLDFTALTEWSNAFAVLCALHEFLLRPSLCGTEDTILSESVQGIMLSELAARALLLIVMSLKFSPDDPSNARVSEMCVCLSSGVQTSAHWVLDEILTFTNGVQKNFGVEASAAFFSDFQVDLTDSIQLYVRDYCGGSYNRLGNKRIYDISSWQKSKLLFVKMKAVDGTIDGNRLIEVCRMSKSEFSAYLKRSHPQSQFKSLPLLQLSRAPKVDGITTAAATTTSVTATRTANMITNTITRPVPEAVPTSITPSTNDNRNESGNNDSKASSRSEVGCGRAVIATSNQKLSPVEFTTVLNANREEPRSNTTNAATANNSSTSTSSTSIRASTKSSPVSSLSLSSESRLRRGKGDCAGGDGRRGVDGCCETATATARDQRRERREVRRICLANSHGNKTVKRRRVEKANGTVSAIRGDNDKTHNEDEEEEEDVSYDWELSISSTATATASDSDSDRDRAGAGAHAQPKPNSGARVRPRNATNTATAAAASASKSPPGEDDDDDDDLFRALATDELQHGWISRAAPAAAIMTKNTPSGTATAFMSSSVAAAASAVATTAAATSRSVDSPSNNNTKGSGSSSKERSKRKTTDEVRRHKTSEIQLTEVTEAPFPTELEQQQPSKKRLPARSQTKLNPGADVNANKGAGTDSDARTGSVKGATGRIVRTRTRAHTRTDDQQLPVVVGNGHDTDKHEKRKRSRRELSRCPADSLLLCGRQ